MGRTIAIANQKGGVGKTTTAINLSACLAEAGQRVLTIDFDPQGNATTGLGLEKEQIEDTVYELLLGDCTLEDCLMRDVQENLDVLPSDSNLAGAEIELLDVENKYDVFVNVIGGGYTGQAGAIRLGIARALLEAEPDSRPALKKEGFLTRDPRAKERKKYGLKKARRAPQFSKR